MTVEEIRNHSFETLPEGGYSPESVDAFVEATAKAYEELFEENKEIVRRLTIFAKKLDEYKRNESYMTETLLTAQKTAAQTIAGAESVVAKMIEAAKNEGKKIINDARDRSNEIYADRDKIIAEAEAQAKEMTQKAASALADATAAAEKEAQVIIDNANAQAKATVDGAKAGIQHTIDEINDNAETVVREANETADKIVSEAVGKAQDTVDAIIADANSAKAAADTLKAEAFELKKEAVLYHDEQVKAGDSYKAERISSANEEADRIRAEAEAFAHSVTSKAKSAAVGILLKAQVDVNRLNDQLHANVEKTNAAIEAATARYVAVKAAADELCAKLTGIADESVMPDNELLAVDENAFVTDSQELNDAVEEADLEKILMCFGINSEEMLHATEQLISDEAEKIAAAKAEAEDAVVEEETEEITEEPEIQETAEKPEEEETAEAVEEETAEEVPATEEAEEMTAEAEDEIAETEEEPASEIDSEFEFDFDFDDAEDIPEAEDVPDATVAFEIPSAEDPVDDLFDDDWDSIDGSGEDDEVKEYIPEVPADSESGTDGFSEVDLDDPVFSSENTDDFEIDFSMFEVDEEKKRARAAEKAENNARKKKKKRR